MVVPVFEKTLIWELEWRGEEKKESCDPNVCRTPVVVDIIFSSSLWKIGVVDLYRLTWTGPVGRVPPLGDLRDSGSLF